MKRHLMRRPSPAMAVALIALFVALGGSSWAALRIGSGQIVNNSVRSKDLRNNDVRGKDVRRSTLGGSDVKNSSLSGVDVIGNGLTGSDIAESSLGVVPAAANAVRAGSVSGLRNSRQVVAADDGTDVPILSAGGFQFLLHCNLGAGNGSRIVIRNVSAGDDSMLDDNLNGDADPDFNEDEENSVNYSVTGTDGIENSAFSAVGSRGSAIHGQSVLLTTPSGFARAPDCVGSVTVQGG
jgi:hypothetical protein